MQKKNWLNWVLTFMKFKNISLSKWLGFTGWAVLFLGVASTNANTLDKVDEAQKASIATGAKDQKQIDRLYEEKAEAFLALKQTKAEIEQYQTYNRQLKAVLIDQSKQIESLKQQILSIEQTEQGIMPLMDSMLTALSDFIASDTPFLMNERQQRIAELKTLLVSSKVTISEKYRRVLEAFQIEIEYGRTIEAYREKNSEGQMVEFLRVGRVGLYSISLDGQSMSYWDRNEKAWNALDDSFKAGLEAGMRVAKQQSAPEFFDVYLPSLEEK